MESHKKPCSKPPTRHIPSWVYPECPRRPHLGKVSHHPSRPPPPASDPERCDPAHEIYGLPSGKPTVCELEHGHRNS